MNNIIGEAMNDLVKTGDAVLVAWIVRVGLFVWFIITPLLVCVGVGIVTQTPSSIA